MNIAPFTAKINSNGQAIVRVQHSLHGLVWKIFQLGLALNQNATFAQCAAHVNGIPLTSTVVMQQSVFSALQALGEAPYAMESFMVGPPYVNLRAGDYISVGVINATVGDTFTVGAYYDEFDAGQPETMGY